MPFLKSAGNECFVLNFRLVQQSGEAEAVVAAVALDDQGVATLMIADVLQEENDRQARKIRERVIREPDDVIQRPQSVGFSHGRDLEVHAQPLGDGAGVVILRDHRRQRSNSSPAAERFFPGSR